MAGLCAALATTAGPRLQAADNAAASTVTIKLKDTPIGKNGSQLKWLPQTSSANEHVVPVQYAAPAEAPSVNGNRVTAQRPTPAVRQVAQQPASDALRDSLGDKIAPARSKQTAAPLELPPLGASPASAPTPALQPSPSAETPQTTAPPATGARSRKVEIKQPRSGQKLQEAITSKEHEFKETCPSIKDLKRIAELTTDIAPKPGDLPRSCALGDSPYLGRHWSPTTFTWTASALCHKPLYFDDNQLERYGHMCGPWLQPIMSGGRFFVTFFILPYEMGLEPPNECIYALGDYRPGSCAPYMLDPFPLSVRAALFEAGAWTGGVFLLH